MFGSDVKYLGHSPGLIVLVGLLTFSLSVLPACSRSGDTDSSPSSSSSSSSEETSTSSTASSSSSSSGSESASSETADTATAKSDSSLSSGETDASGNTSKESSTSTNVRAEGFEQGPGDIQEQRTFQLTDTFVIKPPEEGAGPLRVWFEVPLETALQDVEQLDVNVKSDHSLDWEITEDPEMGNRFLYFERSEAPDQKIVVNVESRVTRRSVSEFYGAKTLSDAERNRFLRKTSEIPVGKKMKEVAEKKGASEPNLKSLRAIYDFVVDNSTYYKSNPSEFTSSGRGSATYCLYQKQGGCTDFHALYLSMGRSIGIPTRFLIGSYLPPAFEGSKDVAYHCWAEAHLNGEGWYSLDAAYGDLWPDKLDFFFGSLDARRVTFSRGRSIDLKPPASEKINYFIKGHIEMGGEPYGNWTRSLTYNEVR